MALGLFSAGCSGTPSDDTPAGTLTLFLGAMDRSADDPEALQEAFLLLDQRARQELANRAKKAESIAGREMKPWEMLVPGRFALRFAPASQGGTRTKITGNRAVVTVTGEKKYHQADISLVREPEGWRIELNIPSQK
jgi:hypothetical protein